MNCAALPAGAEPLIRVKLLEQRRKVAHDAFQLHLDPVQESVAFQTIPLESVLHALGARALDDEADASRTGLPSSMILRKALPFTW